MSLEGLLEALERHPDYSRYLAELNGSTQAPRLLARQGARPGYLSSLWRNAGGPALVLTPRPEDSRRLHDQLLTYLGEDAPVYLLPEPEALPFERLAVDARTVNQRLTALGALARAGEGGPREKTEMPLIVSSVSAALRRTLPPDLMQDSEDGRARNLEVGQRVQLNQLLSCWVDLGFRHEPVVESPGSFSHRGGIIDIFPSHLDLPFRVELWDDEVETIRRFDPVTQRSVGSEERVEVIPAREQLPGLVDRAQVENLIGRMDWVRCSVEARERMEEELAGLFSLPNVEVLPFYNGLLNRASLLDYLSPDSLIVLDRGSQVEAEALDLEEKFARMRESREERGELPRNFPNPYFTWEEFSEGLERCRGRKVEVASWLGDEADPIFHPANLYYGQLDQFAVDMREHQRKGEVVVAVTQHALRLAEILEQEGIGATVSSAIDQPPEPGRVYLMAGALREGWTIPASGESPSMVLLTDAELFGTVKERRYRRRRSREERGAVVALADLIPGSYVVHVDHGVAQFAGTTMMGESGEDKEYLVLEYADSDKLYVPTEHLDRVGAYLGAQDKPPALTRLGTAEWARIKERARGATREIAAELIQLYAARELAQGFRFSEDSAWQRELEDSFPYEETPDQSQAIDQVKADMEEPKPMDRLICGDVGYGKTEVALRAAFKSVSDGMQVGLLVPTTVLAQQHYATFTERLDPFPLKVEVLSRFRTPKEQQEVIAGLKEGTVDIVIGTHRLLQKDVAFKNLGLVVVDEEQKFGVAHKERLKQLRREIDVLTLSATPIPRTLHMALTGIRDMSVMDTPPEARLPVKTFVSEYSEDVIKEAILREMERGGQVFFLHNRVRTIHQTAQQLGEIVPQARFLVGHGQMPEAELEDVMLAFSNGEADVLVCTTIIESGLDMPNVNTLIIDRADRFGLSQLYQLRGRVGRSDNRAYSYLLVPRGRRITDAAEQRIQAILEASDLGSGFRIAMRDMEIRGAGNLLGAAQSGQIHAVGLDLYGQMLREAVEELKTPGDEPVAEGAEAGSRVPDLPRVELPVSAGIPESYISHMPVRLSIYQRLSRVRDRAEVQGFREELRDRFGPLPQEMETLLSLVELRAVAGKAGVESVQQANGAVELVMRNAVGSAQVPLQRALGPSVQVGNQQMRVPLRGLGDQPLPRLTRILERLQVFQDRLNSMAGQLGREVSGAATG